MTFQALKDGYFPIVVGGSNCQSLGAISAMKKYKPASKVVMFDASIDLLMEDNEKFCPLQYLTGLQRSIDFNSLDLTKDMAFIGSRQKDASYNYFKEHGGTIIGRNQVLYKDAGQIREFIQR